MQNTFVQVAVTADCIGEYDSGTFVADFDSEDADAYYFVRKLGAFRTDTIEVEVDVDKVTGDVLRVMILDDTFASEYVLNDAGDELNFSSVAGHSDCCAAFTVSLFYSARRLQAGSHPTSMTMEIAGETNGTLLCCTNLNRATTLSFTSVADLIDGFNYSIRYDANVIDDPWCDIDGIGVVDGRRVLDRVTITKGTTASFVLAEVRRCVIVGRVGGINRFGVIDYSITCADGVDRDVDVALALADWYGPHYDTGCFGTSQNILPGHCNQDGTLTAFAEVP